MLLNKYSRIEKRCATPTTAEDVLLREVILTTAEDVLLRVTRMLDG